jgi:molybdopterin-containing oxidoreductase family iron-sulfur binding subunit
MPVTIDIGAVAKGAVRGEGARVWRSLDELAGNPDFAGELARRLPRFSEWFELDRREFLRLMGASLALAGVGACSREPQEKIVPYVTAPPGASAGEPRYFATAATLGGFATGVLVESHLGRPTKIEGNPSHPASLGGTDVFAQASVLDLWDPDRSQTVTYSGQPGTWEAFGTALQGRMMALGANQGKGLRVLTETVTSPTLAAQLQTLLRRFPNARWHQYEPINRDPVYDGTRLAFGQALDVWHRYDRARTIVSLDADPLVWLALIALLLLTMGSAYLRLGWANGAINLAIALVKALLVMIFFMHLRSSDHLLRIVAAAGFFWLALLVGLAFTDVGVR